MGSSPPWYPRQVSLSGTPSATQPSSASTTSTGATVLQSSAITTTASPTGSVGPTPSVVFKSILEFTACSPGTFSWLYSGQSNGRMSIAINNELPQAAVLSPSSSPTSTSASFTGGVTARSSSVFSVLPRAIPSDTAGAASQINKTLSTTVDPASQTFSWPAVDVPQGWYVAVASIPPFGPVGTSAPFFVQHGSDDSCLTAQAVVSSSSSKTSFKSGPSTAIVGAAHTSGASASHVSPGVIVGSVIGGLAFLALLAALLLCLLRRKKARRASTGSYGQYGPSRRDQLGSTGFWNKRTNGNMMAGDRRTMPDSNFDEVSERTMYDYVPPDEKDDGALSAALTDPFGDHHSAATASRRGSQSSQAKLEMINKHTSSTTVATAYENPRKGSIRSSGESAWRRSNEAPTYPPSPTVYMSISSPTLASPTSAHVRSSSSVMGDVPLSPPTNTDASSPVAPVVRTTSLRKPVRKPVPVYDPTSVPIASRSSSHLPSPSPTTPTNGSAFHQPSSVPPPSAYDKRLSTAVPSNLADVERDAVAKSAHYTTQRVRSHSVGQKQAYEQQRQQQLVHKSSFGPGGVEGKPLHYLMPDMPLGSQ